MAPKERTRRSKGCHGAALLELAIILPLVVTIVLGCIDFGRVAYAYIAVVNAAREGAAYGSSHVFNEDTRAQWEQDVRAAVLAEMEGMPRLTPVGWKSRRPSSLVIRQGFDAWRWK